MITRIPQVTTTQYFEQAPFGLYKAGYQPPLPAVRATNDGSLGKALGHFLMTSPVSGAAKLAGLGTDAEDVAAGAAAGGMAMFAAILIVGGAFSYQIGKAMAPSKSQQTSYGLLAIPLGLMSPYLGLGSMAIYSNLNRS